jgi:hypothetical protein
MQLLSEPREIVEVTRKGYLVLKRAIHVGVASKRNKLPSFRATGA